MADCVFTLLLWYITIYVAVLLKLAPLTFAQNMRRFQIVWACQGLDCAKLLWELLKNISAKFWVHARKPTLGLNDPPELDGKGDAVEEGGGEADDDGGGEERAAAAGVQEGHRQGVVFKTSPESSILGFIHKSLVKIVSITVSQFRVLPTLHHESCHQWKSHSNLLESRFC